jgi:hypothetical protein
MCLCLMLNYRDSILERGRICLHVIAGVEATHTPFRSLSKVRSLVLKHIAAEEISGNLLPLPIMLSSHHVQAQP